MDNSRTTLVLLIIIIMVAMWRSGRLVRLLSIAYGK